MSKSWFDISLMAEVDHQKRPVVGERFDNTDAGIKKLDKWLKCQNVSFNQNSLLVIENTGVYHRLLWKYCSENGLPIYIGNAAHIKNSFGLVRGKNDKIDSQRLCSFAWKNADEIKATPALNAVFLRLKDLLTSRDRIVDQIAANQKYLDELKASNSKETQNLMVKMYKDALTGLKKSKQLIEDTMEAIVSNEATTKDVYDILLSIPGIGPITATYLIVCTNNFANNISGKQIASYAGVAPFRDSSGTSIKGRNKVHHMGNKELKAILHMCVLSLKEHNNEFRDYYERKTAAGKHPLSVLNAMKSKLLLRVVAVVKSKKEYVDNYVDKRKKAA